MKKNEVVLIKNATIPKQDVMKMSLAELYRKIETSENGLEQKEATKRVAEYGPNLLGKKTKNALTVFIRQFKSSIVYLLIIASLTAYAIRDYTDGTIIFIILLINTSLGFYQEYKSEKIIETLSRLITKQIRLKRDGQMVLLDESQIVPGDVLMVREGDIVPADMRLIKADALQVNESQLTGESIPVIKRIAAELATTLEELLFTGSTIEKGEGVGIVYATGKNTELGAIAKLSTETKKQTQYEKSLQSFSSFLIKIVVAGLSLVFIIKLILSHGTSNTTNLFLFIIALAVSTVPEVLPVIATVTLSSGAIKLAEKHVVVRRLSSLEDLGNVNLLCTDKTGTITENKMAVHGIVSNDDALLQKFAFAAITPLKSRKHRAQNSYDDAFFHYIPDHIKQEAKHFAIAKELPFDPDDRRSRVVLEDQKANRYYLVSVGAPETIFAIAHGDHKTGFLRDIAQEGKSGLHHLAFAYKEISYTKDFDILKNEHDLALLGYVSFEDPLRPTAKSTIEHAERLGVKIKILTGDSREVAEYIGKQIGLLAINDKVYLGDELDAMSPSEFKTAVLNSHVFARVSPVQKFNIIKILKKDYVVAYQGDGINDAPSLKLADVAIAVNSATDIAKENADIVLLNKSLEVIINGIKYGRSIFVNINKYIKYTMLNNFGIFISLSVLYLFSTDLPLLPVQVLLNNLIGDGPLITVFSDTVEDSEVVKPEKHNIKKLLFLAVVWGIPTALFELLYFFIIHSQPERVVQTSLYVFFTFQALIIFYTIRSTGHFWKAKMPSRLLNVSFVAAFVFAIAIVYMPPFQTWFSFAPLPAISIAVIITFVLFYFLATDIVKVWYYQRSALPKSGNMI